MNFRGPYQSPCTPVIYYRDRNNNDIQTQFNVTTAALNLQERLFKTYGDDSDTAYGIFQRLREVTKPFEQSFGLTCTVLENREASTFDVTLRRGQQMVYSRSVVVSQGDTSLLVDLQSIGYGLFRSIFLSAAKKTDQFDGKQPPPDWIDKWGLSTYGDAGKKRKKDNGLPLKLTYVNKWDPNTGENRKTKKELVNGQAPTGWLPDPPYAELEKDHFWMCVWFQFFACYRAHMGGVGLYWLLPLLYLLTEEQHNLSSTIDYKYLKSRDSKEGFEECMGMCRENKAYSIGNEEATEYSRYREDWQKDGTLPMFVYIHRQMCVAFDRRANPQAIGRSPLYAGLYTMHRGAKMHTILVLLAVRGMPAVTAVAWVLPPPPSLPSLSSSLSSLPTILYVPAMCSADTYNLDVRWGYRLMKKMGAGIVVFRIDKEKPSNVAGAMWYSAKAEGANLASLSIHFAENMNTSTQAITNSRKVTQEETKSIVHRIETEFKRRFPP